MVDTVRMSREVVTSTKTEKLSSIIEISGCMERYACTVAVLERTEIQSQG